MAVSDPLINSHRYSWASIECNINGGVVRDVTEIKWSEELAVSWVEGTGGHPVGRTRGDYKPSGSMVLLKQAAKDLKAALVAQGGGAKGWGEVAFDIRVQFEEEEEGVTTVELLGCRLVKTDNSNAKGSDATTESFDLSIFDIKENGLVMAVRR